MYTFATRGGVNGIEVHTTTVPFDYLIKVLKRAAAMNGVWEHQYLESVLSTYKREAQKFNSDDPDNPYGAFCGVLCVSIITDIIRLCFQDADLASLMKPLSMKHQRKLIIAAVDAPDPAADPEKFKETLRAEYHELTNAG